MVLCSEVGYGQLLNLTGNIFMCTAKPVSKYVFC